MPEELSRNRFDIILQQDWPIEQCDLHIRVFFGRKTKSPCLVLFIHWLIKQIINTYRNHFSRPCENRSNRRTVKSILLVKKFLGLVEMTSGRPWASKCFPQLARMACCKSDFRCTLLKITFFQVERNYAYHKNDI